MMNNKKQTSICDLSLDVLSGVCTDEERVAFERHLPSCEACQADKDELQLIWEALYADMEPIEPPMDLKQQVMDAAFAADTAMAVQTVSTISRRKPRRRWLFTASAALVLALLILGSAWNITLYQKRASGPLPIEQALSVSASQVSKVVSLQPQFPAESQAFGIACIIDNGKSKQFVVYVYGAPDTIGTQAYQVWLIKDGVRRSAGTFRVSDEGKGVGVLAMPIQSDTLSFDTIGITLEPDDKGDQPRGEKILGSV
ncbi:anti-sigma factor [Paenibacillus monticola]|uniref:Regulator of SigK n=1 Tax=Paenibacillus monticola TaxID=2666075 RepID=A0A7X2H7N1_9BACL|nr:anti-sigma factor [Paenibacillus monticola]MRN55039.1 hypothetical protein [Paenibacillus monticola]